METDPKVVLVVGSCGLDRLMTVQSYPKADAKVLTKAYHEVGGGNAANTASAMALLSTSKMFQQNIRVKLLTKLGHDHIGHQLSEELKQAGVDLTSPLFRIGDLGTTTAFTSIVVSETEHTRTCFHTHGTCGNLTANDVTSTSMDEVFEGVVHLHSDGRHTEASVLLAREARKRNIPVSVDAEKDRKTPYMGELLEIATLLFTNSSQLDDYIERRTVELESQSGRKLLTKEDITVGGNSQSNINPNVYALCTLPSLFFHRWYGQSQLNKEVVITKGSMGALHVQCKAWESSESQISKMNEEAHNQTIVTASEDSSLTNVQYYMREANKVHEAVVVSSARYEVRSVGVLRDASVVDTTGAGDAFIGGYLMSTLLLQKDSDTENVNIKFGLQFGSWVSGIKLSGPGARSALPRGCDVDEALGENRSTARQMLDLLLCSFQEYPSSRVV